MSEIRTVIEKKNPRKAGKVLKIILLSLLVLLIAILALIPPLIMKGMIPSHADFKEYSPSDFGVNAVRIGITTEDDLKLVSWEVGTEQTKAVVLFLSGIQNPSVTAFFGHAKMLAENGYSSLLIEMRSHGKSEGDKIYLGMKEYLDVKAGVRYIRSKEEYRKVPIIVFGVSMGGATAINSIGEIEGIDGLISASAYSSWVDVFCDNMAGMGAPEPLAALEKPFVWLYLGLEYGFGNVGINPLNEIKNLNGRPALLMHSKGDTQVPFKSFERLVKAAPKQVDTYTCEGDYHFICRKDFKDPLSDPEYANAILQFLKANFNE